MRAPVRSFLPCGAVALAILSLFTADTAQAQAPTGSVVPALGTKAEEDKGGVQPAGCSTCSNGLFGSPLPSTGGCGPGGCGRDCGGPCGPGQCYAGKQPCDCGSACASGPFGGTLLGIYQCVCCNDPCYEPRWVALANNAFTVDNIRPVTQMKLGVDFGWDLRNPDKSELFFAQVNQKGPRGPANSGPSRVDYSRAYMVNEAAVNGVFSVSVTTSILAVEPDNGFNSASGFGDIILGTKSILLDCELLQAAFQFKTYLPTGNFNKGLSTGHTSLEPSLLAALKVSEFSYVQGQVGYFFPIGGTGGFQGALVYGGLAYNHLLWNCGHDIELIGTLEANLACTTHGRYTNALTGVTLPSNDLGAFFNAGPGVRLVMCKKVDLGIGTAFALTNESIMGNLLRMEFRWRF